MKQKTKGRYYYYKFSKTDFYFKSSEAAKLVWKGGDDVYKANKRDVATLKEYWLFFALLEI